MLNDIICTEKCITVVVKYLYGQVGPWNAPG